MDRQALLDALHEIRGALLFGNQYVEDEGIDIDFDFDLLTHYIKGETLNPFEMVGEFDDGQAFEMMASTCEAIRNLADAYGGDKHFNTCVLMALRSCIAALEGLNK